GAENRAQNDPVALNHDSRIARPSATLSPSGEREGVRVRGQEGLSFVLRTARIPLRQSTPFQTLRMKAILVTTLVIAALTRLALGAEAQEWTRFRGPNGTGVSHAQTIPARITD